MSVTRKELKWPQMTSNELVKNKRNKLKGGDPNEDNIHGGKLIEQAFSSN